MPNRHFLRSDIFIFAMVYSFYFRLFPPNELNSLGGEKGERSGVCYYSGSMPVRHFYLLALILYLLWSILFIFCVLAPEGGGESRRLLLAREMYYPKNYFLSLTNSKEKGHYHLIILTALRRQYQNKPRPSDLFPLSLQKE